MAQFLGSQNDPSLPGPSGLNNTPQLVPINPSNRGQFMGMGINTSTGSGTTPLHRDPIHQLRPHNENFCPSHSVIQPFIYFNIGPAPGPCKICRYSSNSQPKSIYLQHCIPQCPAIVTNHNLVYATSDFVGRNDVRPCVVYLPGSNIPSSVPEDSNETAPIYIGLFILPNPQDVYTTEVPRTQLGSQRQRGSYAHGSNLTNPFWNIYGTFNNHAPPRYPGYQTQRPQRGNQSRTDSGPSGK